MLPIAQVVTVFVVSIAMSLALAHALELLEKCASTKRPTSRCSPSTIRARSEVSASQLGVLAPLTRDFRDHCHDHASGCHGCIAVTNGARLVGQS